MAEGVTLHMYISQPPCGDACISPGGAATGEGAAGGDGAPAAKRLRVSTDDKRLVASPAIHFYIVISQNVFTH